MQLIKLANHQLHTKNSEIIQNDKIKLGSAAALTVYPDETAPIVDDNDREGWLFSKVSATDKFNFYIYGNTATSHQWKMGDLKSVSMTCSVDTWSNSASVPYIIIYSAPTGTGDAGAWYHSKRTYSINTSNHKILCGEHINLYCMSKPELKNDNRYIELETYSSEGDNLDTEVILAVSLHSDSGSAINTKILVSHAGYNLGNEIHRHIKLVT
tara:strand:+ start:7196 stop:7831 length:636 start_codon:yes stop_codon:yes gene_type:complete